MSYRFVYSNEPSSMRTTAAGSYGTDPMIMPVGNRNDRMSKSYESDHRQRSYSSETFSSDAGSTDEYDHRDSRLTAQRSYLRAVVRAPTPPPIFKRVFERAPTPDTPVMERIIIRPRAQRIIERVVEQRRTPPLLASRLMKEVHQERRPVLARARAYTQPSLFYGQPCRTVSSFANRMISTASDGFREHHVVDPFGSLSTFQNNPHSNRSFSSTSSFECIPSTSMTPVVTSPAPSSSVMPHLSMFPPIMYQPVYLPSLRSPYVVPFALQRFPLTYGPMLAAGGIIPTVQGFVSVPKGGYPSQLPFHPFITQQLAY